MDNQKRKFVDEEQLVQELLTLWHGHTSQDAQRIAQNAAVLVETARARKQKSAASFQGLMENYDLSSQEGLALMCLAEALLRVPDATTANALIEDKIADSDWEALFGQSMDWLGRMSGMGLKATQGVLGSMAGRMGMPVIRKACVTAMQVMAKTFVIGRTIQEAVKQGQRDQRHGYSHSYDMLGEGARNVEDAERYFESYKRAITHIAQTAQGVERLSRPGVSIKLSALHPRYEPAQAELCVPVLKERLEILCRMAMEGDISLTVDAEEADRLDLSKEIIASIPHHPVFKHWDGYGMAIQAYQKQALNTVAFALDLARQSGQKINVRLVKGAYWDTEIKHAQVEGLPGFPVFTRKAHTDVSFLSCAKQLMDHRDLCIPMIGTHNAHTVAAVLDMAGDDKSGFMFQRLQGMGEGLYAQIVADGYPCSIYAPVGTHKDLLAYLVRRLLENGANTSFVNKLYDMNVDVADLVVDPIESVRAYTQFSHQAVALPVHIMQPSHQNSHGLDLSDSAIIADIEADLRQFRKGRSRVATPLIEGESVKQGTADPVNSPADRSLRLGDVYVSQPSQCEKAMQSLADFQPEWAACPVETRAIALEKLADLMAQDRSTMMALLCHEAGKTVTDALGECREAEDFCRYYANQARNMMAIPHTLPGPAGEENALTYRGKGVFVAISPWNFPMAIFTGQIVAALVSGNCVAIKPAPQTPFIAGAIVKLMIKAGIPAKAVAFLPGGADVGQALVADAHCRGVAFTGSTQTARGIARMLAQGEGALVPLIAETGGQNAMIVDSTALPEQVCDDVIDSAFGAAGQRCSALRVLYLQEDIADSMITMISRAMRTRMVGHPQFMANDIGPVIDHHAQAQLRDHKAYLMQVGKILAEMRIDPEIERQGNYVAPVMAEISDIGVLKQEMFGPFLHVIRYQADRFDQVVKDIHSTGFGLTFGLHSRINTLQARLLTQMQVGNLYINRGITGAVVGSQPFGGCGLSGTGPKAGGPNYLHAFTDEISISINSAAAGGNANLMIMNEVEGDKKS